MSDPKRLQPPVPRDRHQPSLSEVIPFRSKKINIWRSKALLPLLMVAIVVVFLYNTRLTPFVFNDFVALVGIAGIFFGVYFYSGIQKQWWWYLVPGGLCWAIFTYLFHYYAYVFRTILPGNTHALENNHEFIPNFIAYFFAAGMCEELVKATPILLALVLTLARRPAPPGPTPGLIGIFWRKRGSRGILDALGLQGPLDGMLMGFASGAAFILLETLGEYVPNVIEETFKESHNKERAFYLGLSLLLPRILQAVSGHMGWAAIFGYFIGLSARYPRRALMLIPIGYLVAALLHGLWDSVDTLPYPNYWLGGVSIVSVLIFVACLLKARQLELSWGTAAFWNESILVDGPAALAGELPTPAKALAAQPAVGGVLAGLQGVASGLEAVAGGVVRPAAPPPRFSIGTLEARYALDAGHSIDFGSLFGPTGPAVGAQGEIDWHPTEPNVLGLKNTGAAAWASTSPDGVTVSVPPGRSLRIAAGTRIAFGALTVDIQRY